MDPRPTLRNVQFGTSVPRQTVRKDSNGNQTITQYTLNQFTEGEYRAGWTVPSWRTLIRQSQSATSPMTGVISKIVERQQGFYSIRAKFGTQVIEDTFNGIHAGPFGQGIATGHVGGYDPAKAYNMALIQLRNAVKSQQQQWSGPTFLGELKETVGFLKRPASALLDGLMDYANLLEKRRKRIRAPNRKTERRILQDMITGTWLATALGLQPLLQDCNGAAETIARFLVERELFHPHTELRGTGSHTVSDIGGEQVILGFSLAGESWMKKVTECRVILRCGYSAMTNPLERTLPRLMELSGFKLSEFVPTVYQLIPYSFLLDYITNVGDVLNVAFIDTSRVTWINKSEVVHTLKQVRTSARDVLGGTDRVQNIGQGWGGGSYTSSLKTVTRTKLNELDMPYFEIDASLSDKQVLNTLALVFGRHRKLQERFVAPGKPLLLV